MSPSRPCLYVESRADKRFAEVLLQPYAVEIIDGMTTSGAIALAQFSLLEYPERPIAVLLDAPAGDGRESAELRATVKRLLARTAPEGWYVGLAIPRLDAWAMTDPRIKQDFELHAQGKADYFGRAARIGKLTKSQPFDPSVLYRQSEDFRGLIDFLQRYAPAVASK
jgi:hypothetical protein